MCDRAGVTPHVLIGDFDSLDESVLQRLESRGADVVRFPEEKDATDLELAVREAIPRGATELTITCAATGRLDHTLAALGTLASQPQLRPRLVEPDLTVHVLAASGRDSLVLSAAGTGVSILAFGGCAVVSAVGLKWPLDREILEPTSARGLSNVVVSEDSLITVHDGTVLVFRPGAPGA